MTSLHRHLSCGLVSEPVSIQLLLILLESITVIMKQLPLANQHTVLLPLTDLNSKNLTFKATFNCWSFRNAATMNYLVSSTISTRLEDLYCACTALVNARLRGTDDFELDTLYFGFHFRGLEEELD